MRRNLIFRRNEFHRQIGRHFLYDAFGLDSKHAEIRSAHADVGDICRSLRQNTFVRRRHMRVRAEKDCHSSVEIMGECLLFGGRFRMEVKDGNIIFSLVALQYPVGADKRIFKRSIMTIPSMLITRTDIPAASVKTAPSPGTLPGKFAGRRIFLFFSNKFFAS